MVIWALILLPLTDMDYSAGPIEEMDGIAELFGDDSKLMISYELISGRPEVVLSLHTGDLTPTSLITQDTKLDEFDGAIACTDDSEWQGFFDDSQQINIIELALIHLCLRQEMTCYVDFKAKWIGIFHGYVLHASQYHLLYCWIYLALLPQVEQAFDGGLAGAGGGGVALLLARRSYSCLAFLPD